MPRGLERFQETHQNHFLTFSCYRRQPKLASVAACDTLVSALVRVRQAYGLCVYGYVIMPEHVHLLVNEPERSNLAQVLKSLKQGVARGLALRAEEPFWQERYYDFNVWSERKFVGKAAISSSQSSEARIGGKTGRLALEQLPSLRDRRNRRR